MSGPNFPATPPPEVPEQFADAYREAYERALAGQKQAGRVQGHHGAGGVHRTRPAGTREQPAIEEAPAGEAPVGAHADWDAVEAAGAEEGWTEYSVESAYDRFRASRWFVPALLVLAAGVLVLGAYGVGRVLAAGVHDAGPVAGQTARASVPASDPSAQHSSPQTSNQTSKAHQKKQQQPAVWHGTVTAVRAASASAGCTAPASVDSAGHPVTYRPAEAVDGHADTAWRCPGKAIGRKLVVHLPHAVAVGEVGLVPGYAKTDPDSGANRYAENNRITKVRWILGNGTTVVQHLSGSAHDRSLRTVRVPRTTTDTVILQVLAVQEGPRDTTCVSEVRVGRVT